MNLNSIAITFANGVIVPAGTDHASDKAVLAIQVELSKFGYTLSGPALAAVRKLNQHQLTEFFDSTIPVVASLVGGHLEYNPLFRNFPIIPDDVEYLLRRILGFLGNELGIVDPSSKVLSCGHAIDPNLFNIDDFGACPICQFGSSDPSLNHNSDDFDKLYEKNRARELTLLSEDTLISMATNFVQAKTSLSPSQKDFVSGVMAHFDLPVNAIPFKENLVYFTKTLLQNNKNIPSHVQDQFKTATDVLRLAVGLNDGDISLAVKTKIKLSNPQRRLVMALLENVSCLPEDMKRRRITFLGLGEVLHIGKYAKRYPKTAKAFDLLRNDNKSIVTFNSQTELLALQLLFGNKMDLVTHLAERPGEFARRLDFMLRNGDSEIILSTFIDVVDKLTTPMLMTLGAFFRNRHMKEPFRYFLPKGQVSKIQIVDDYRKTVSENICKQVQDIVRNCLLDRFSDLPDLGRVYLDPSLMNFTIPLTLRNATKNLTTAGRGTRIQAADTKYTRLFLYWKNCSNNDRVDVDLSAIGFNESWENMGHVSYTRLSGQYAVHSGDIQSAPDGAAEFIEIDREMAKKNNVRYILMNVISFTGQPFNTFYALAGIQSRNTRGANLDEGRRFDPSTVEDAFELSSESTYAVPLIFDVKTNELIWADLALGGTKYYVNVESRSTTLAKYCQVISNMANQKPTMYQLFWLHAHSRGTQVDEIRVPGVEYDIELTRDFVAKNMSTILADWLS